MEKRRELTEFLSLTKDEKFTQSQDKPFNTSVTCSVKNEDLTVHEQLNTDACKSMYVCPLVTDTVLISKKLVQSISINPNIMQYYIYNYGGELFS